MLIHQQRGSALLAALVIVLVLGLFGGAFVALTTSETGMAASYRDGVAAEYLAEAGALYARVKLKTDKSFRTLTDSDAPTLLPAVTKNTGATTGTYTVSVTRYANNPLKREIVSTGTVGSAKRVMRVVLNLAPLEGYFTQELLPIVQYGLFSNGVMSFDNGVIVGNPSYPANIRSNATITIKNNAVVYGNVTSGSTVNYGTTRPTGTILQNQPALMFPDISGYSTLYRQYASAVYNTSYTISGTYALNGGFYYVNGDLTIANNTILSGAGLFYVTGKVILNNNIRNGKILILAVGDIIVNNGAQMDTAMLITKSNIIIDQNSVVNGGAYAGGTITMGNARLTYDNALMSLFATYNDKGKVESYRNY